MRVADLHIDLEPLKTWKEPMRGGIPVLLTDKDGVLWPQGFGFFTEADCKVRRLSTAQELILFAEDFGTLQKMKRAVNTILGHDLTWDRGDTPVQELVTVDEIDKLGYESTRVAQVAGYRAYGIRFRGPGECCSMTEKGNRSCHNSE